MSRILVRTILTAALLGLAVPVAHAQIITSDLAFARGSTEASANGTIRGPQTRDYIVRARAGQVMDVRLAGSPIVFFNVLAPGSTGEAIFIGSNEGNRFSGTLSTTGAYRIRVYQMRASARRGQVGGFNLRVSVTGGAMGGGLGAGNGLGGLAGMNSIAAIDAIRARGFVNVDSTTLGNTEYGIYYNRSTRVCAQLTNAGGRVTDARDIRQHPLCR